MPSKKYLQVRDDLRRWKRSHDGELFSYWRTPEGNTYSWRGPGYGVVLDTGQAVGMSIGEIGATYGTFHEAQGAIIKHILQRKKRGL